MLPPRGERGPSLRAAGVRGRVDPPREPRGSHRSHLLQKGDPFPLSPAAGAPRAGYRPAPRFFGFFFLGLRTCRGGRSRARVECTTAGAGARTPRPPPSSTPALLPGRDLSSWGVPSFPILSPWGRCIPTGIGAGVVFLRWHQLLGLEGPLLRRPLSLRGDYLLAAALFSPGHGACVGCGSCAGKPQSPWSDRGMGPLALPLPAPGLTPPAPDPARQLRPCGPGERGTLRGTGHAQRNGHGQSNRHGRLVPPCPGAAPLSRLGGDDAVGPVGPAVLRRGGCTL